MCPRLPSDPCLHPTSKPSVHQAAAQRRKGLGLVVKGSKKPVSQVAALGVSAPRPLSWAAGGAHRSSAPERGAVPRLPDALRKGELPLRATQGTLAGLRPSSPREHAAPLLMLRTSTLKSWSPLLAKTATTRLSCSPHRCVGEAFCRRALPPFSLSLPPNPALSS